MPEERQSTSNFWKLQKHRHQSKTHLKMQYKIRVSVRAKNLALQPRAKLQRNEN